LIKILRINYGKRRSCSAGQRENKLKKNVIMIVVMKCSIFENFYNAYVFHEIVSTISNKM
jgi:hypothetical protein